jgi:hypothetical protein
MFRVGVVVGVLVPGVAVAVKKTIPSPGVNQPLGAIVLVAPAVMVADGGTGVGEGVTVGAAVAVAGTSVSVAVVLGVGGTVAVTAEVGGRGANGCSNVAFGTVVALTRTVRVGICDSEGAAVWPSGTRRCTVAGGGAVSSSCANAAGVVIQRIASSPHPAQRRRAGIAKEDALLIALVDRLVAKTDCRC